LTLKLTSTIDVSLKETLVPFRSQLQNYLWRNRRPKGGDDFGDDVDEDVDAKLKKPIGFIDEITVIVIVLAF
jgi:hypothetical protein